MALSPETIQAVWNKGRTVPGQDPARVRKDECGALISRYEHGKRNSTFGWEVDHISPEGSDAIGNLRPLQWENNVAKSDGRLVCVVTANGASNMRRS